MNKRTELFWQGPQWYLTKLFEIGTDYAAFQFLVEFNETNEAIKNLSSLFEKCKLIGMVFSKEVENLVQKSIANPTGDILNELEDRLVGNEDEEKGGEIPGNMGRLGYGWDRNVFDLGFELQYLYMCLQNIEVIKKLEKELSVSLRDEKDLERIANILKLDPLVKNDILRVFEKIRPYENDLMHAPTSIGKLKISKMIDTCSGIIISGCKIEEFFTKWDRRAIKGIPIFLTFAVFIGYGVLYHFAITYWGTDPNLINGVIGGIFGITLLGIVYKFVHSSIENIRKRQILERFSKQSS